MKANKLILSTSLFCLSMMSSAITLANTIDQGMPVEEQQDQEATFTISDNSSVKQLNKELTKTKTASKSTTQVSGSKSDTTETYEYPTFTSSELAGNFSFVSEVENPESPEESEEGIKDDLREHVKKIALLYQHFPTDPVYTYGRDNNGEGEGACIGTEEFCARSALIWTNFEQRAAEDELIVVEEGNLVMPAEYALSAQAQPHVAKTEGSELESNGYTLFENGNEFKNGKHYGKREGNKYYVKYLAE